MSKYPEHDKMRAVKEDADVISAFLEWLFEQNLHLGKWEDYWDNGEERYIPADEVGQKLGRKFMHEESTPETPRYTDLAMYAKSNPNFEQRPAGCYQDHRGIEKFLADYFDIDLKKIEEEKRQMLDGLQGK